MSLVSDFHLVLGKPFSNFFFQPIEFCRFFFRNHISAVIRCFLTFELNVRAPHTDANCVMETPIKTEIIFYSRVIKQKISIKHLLKHALMHMHIRHIITLQYISNNKLEQHNKKNETYPYTLS